jgi:hypothetical protein
VFRHGTYVLFSLSLEDDSCCGGVVKGRDHLKDMVIDGETEKMVLREIV